MSHQFTVYSKVATARLLGIAVGLVKKLEVFANAVWVHVQGNRPTFISKTRYQVDFLESRADRSAEIEITPTGIFSYIAYNLKSGNSYKLYSLPGEGLQCECKDFERQKWGGKDTPTCKHRIAVNQWLNDKFPMPAHA